MASGSDTDELSSKDCFTDTARIRSILRDETSSKDRSTDTARIKSILRNETSALLVNGDFASAGMIKKATDPQISRSAPGSQSQCSTSVIELPLCEEDANSLFPERRKTIVGQGPNPWVTAAENIEIGNETFTHSVTGLLTDLKTSLGIPEHVQLTARLNHLALFERGDVSTDSLQVTDKTIKARLLIVMPSDRIGGVFSVSIGEEKKEFKAEPSAMSYACWYPDARLSISILQSGHILGLLYDVIEHEVEHAEGNEQAALKAGLELWTSPNTAPTELLHVLDHEYTTQSLVLDQLKGSDLSVARAFARLSQTLEFSIFLASMERKVKRGDDMCGYEVYEKKLKLRSVHDLEGDQLATDVVVSPEQIIQRGVYKDRDPDESNKKWEDGTYYNDYYKDHVLVLVKRDNVAKFLTKSTMAASTLIQIYIQKLGSTTRDDVIRRELLELCDRVVNLMLEAARAKNLCSYTTFPFTDEAVGAVSKALLALGETSRLVKAVGCTEQELPPDAIEMLLDAAAQIPLETLQPILQQALATHDSLAKLLIILRRLFDDDLSRKGEDWKIWAESLLFAMVDKLREVPPQGSSLVDDSFNKGSGDLSLIKDPPEDGAALAEVLIHTRSAQFLRERVLPILKRFAVNARFFVGFFGRLRASASLAEEQTAILQEVLGEVYNDCDFNLAGPKTSEPYWRRELEEEPPPVGPLLRTSIGHALFLTVEFALCSKAFSKAALETLLERILDQAKRTTGRKYGHTYLPFAEVIAGLVSESDWLQSEVKHTLRASLVGVLENYIMLYVKKQPAQGTRDVWQHKRRWKRPHLVTVEFGGEEHEAWVKRCGKAVDHLGKLDANDLLRRALKGDYERITNLWDVVQDWKRAPPYLTPQALHERRDAQLKSSTRIGEKRKVQVIELD